MNNSLNMSANFVTTYDSLFILNGLLDTEKKYLQSVAIFDIQVNVSVNSESITISPGSAVIQLEVNDAPKDGSSEISFEGGDEIVELSTEVTVTCFNWVDEDETKFYRFDLWDGISLITICNLAISTSHTCYLGFGNYTLIAYIYDTVGTYETFLIDNLYAVLPTGVSVEQLQSSVSTFLDESYFDPGDNGDISTMAMATMASVSYLDYIGTLATNSSNFANNSNNTYKNVIDQLTDTRSEMIYVLFDTFDLQPVTDDNLELQVLMMSTICRTPSQVDSQTAVDVLLRMGFAMDATSGMSNQMANALVDGMTTIGQSFNFHLGSMVSLNGGLIEGMINTQTAAKLVKTMLDVVMIDMLSGSLPGEPGYQYEGESSGTSVSGKRFDPVVNANDDGSIDSCAGDSLEYNQMGTILEDMGINQFDCLYSQTPADLWDSINGEKLFADVISLDLRDSDDNTTYNRTKILRNIIGDAINESRRRNRMRRRLATDDIISTLNISNLSACSVFVFDMYHTDDANFTDWITVTQFGVNISLPICRYFNTQREEWTSEGCWAVGTNATSNGTFTRCACTHLSSFSISAKDFTPEINTISIEHLRQIKWSNIRKHPNAVLISACLLLLFWMTIMCLPRENDKPMVAQLRPWSQLQQRKWPKFLPKKQNDVLLMKATHLEKLFRYYWIYLRNNHPMFHVCFRDFGTNWSGPQRVFCFLVSILTMSAANAAYYGHIDYSFESLNFGVARNILYASASGSIIPILLGFFFGYHTPKVAVEKKRGLHEKLVEQYHKVVYGRIDIDSAMNMDDEITKKQNLHHQQASLDLYHNYSTNSHNSRNYSQSNQSNQASKRGILRGGAAFGNGEQNDQNGGNNSNSSGNESSDEDDENDIIHENRQKLLFDHVAVEYNVLSLLTKADIQAIEQATRSKAIKNLRMKTDVTTDALFDSASGTSSTRRRRTKSSENISLDENDDILTLGRTDSERVARKSLKYLMEQRLNNTSKFLQNVTTRRTRLSNADLQLSQLNTMSPMASEQNEQDDRNSANNDNNISNGQNGYVSVLPNSATNTVDKSSGGEHDSENKPMMLRLVTRPADGEFASKTQSLQTLGYEESNNRYAEAQKNRRGDGGIGGIGDETGIISSDDEARGSSRPHSADASPIGTDNGIISNNNNNGSLGIRNKKRSSFSGRIGGKKRNTTKRKGGTKGKHNGSDESDSDSDIAVEYGSRMRRDSQNFSKRASISSRYKSELFSEQQQEKHKVKNLKPLIDDENENDDHGTGSSSSDNDNDNDDNDDSDTKTLDSDLEANKPTPMGPDPATILDPVDIRVYQPSSRPQSKVKTKIKTKTKTKQQKENETEMDRETGEETPADDDTPPSKKKKKRTRFTIEISAAAETDTNTDINTNGKEKMKEKENDVRRLEQGSNNNSLISPSQYSGFGTRSSPDIAPMQDNHTASVITATFGNGESNETMTIPLRDAPTQSRTLTTTSVSETYRRTNNRNKVKTLRQSARIIQWDAIRQSINFANRMLIPTVLTETNRQLKESTNLMIEGVADSSKLRRPLINDRISEGNETDADTDTENKSNNNDNNISDEKLLGDDEYYSDETARNKDGNQGDKRASGKFRSLIPFAKKKELYPDTLDVYFESREISPEENAALTLVQAHIISYIYWWPNCLVTCAWVLGLTWICICSLLILIYGINFDLLNELDVADSVKAGIISNTTCNYTFIAYDVELESQVDYDVSNEYALTNSGQTVDNGWGDVPDTISWFMSFLGSLGISLVFFTPATGLIISCLKFTLYSTIWKPKPKMHYYKLHYDNKDEMEKNIIKFTDKDLWNGIAVEIGEVQFAEHPYWVLEHPYVKEMRRRNFLTGVSENTGVFAAMKPAQEIVSLSTFRQQGGISNTNQEQKQKQEEEEEMNMNDDKMVELNYAEHSADSQVSESDSNTPTDDDANENDNDKQASPIEAPQTKPKEKTKAKSQVKPKTQGKEIEEDDPLLRIIEGTQASATVNRPQSPPKGAVDGSPIDGDHLSLNPNAGELQHTKTLSHSATMDDSRVREFMDFAQLIDDEKERDNKQSKENSRRSSKRGTPIGTLLRNKQTQSMSVSSDSEVDDDNNDDNYGRRKLSTLDENGRFPEIHRQDSLDHIVTQVVESPRTHRSPKNNSDDEANGRNVFFDDDDNDNDNGGNKVEHNRGITSLDSLDGIIDNVIGSARADKSSRGNQSYKE